MVDSVPPEKLTIAGRYRLKTKLGQGGMGSVWRAEHLTLGSDVAVKLIDGDAAENDEARTRFVREAKAAAALRSPHVVQMIDYGVDDGIPFIAMELMEGESLADRLKRKKTVGPEETSRIISEVSRALGKAHEAKIVHRDLKPDNVFLVHNDDTEVAKVLDFGIAKANQYDTTQAGVTATGALLGTPYYMSPEQAEGSKIVDHRTDIWALGVMAFECLVGKRPFEGTTLGGLFVNICSRPLPVPSEEASVPVGFDEWFARCANRDLDSRFPTAREAAAELRTVCTPDAPRTTEHSVPKDGVPTLEQGTEESFADTVGNLSGHATTTGASIVSVLLKKSQGSRVLLSLALGGTALVTGALLLVPDREEESSNPATTPLAEEEEKQGENTAESEPSTPSGSKTEPKTSEIKVNEESEETNPGKAASAKYSSPTTEKAKPPPVSPRPTPQPRPVLGPVPSSRPKPTSPAAKPKPRPAPKQQVDLGI